jgi:hypothetical protein
VNGVATILLVALITVCAVTAILIGGDLVQEALDELEARREWAEIQRRSDARRHLTNTAPRSVR